MSIHTHTTEVEYFNSTHEVEIDFEYTPGYPETGPTHSCGGEPRVSAKAVIFAVRLCWGEGVPPLPMECIPLEWEQEIEEKLIEFVESEDH